MSFLSNPATALLWPVVPLVIAWPVWAPALVWLAYGSLRPVAAGPARPWRVRAPRGLWLLLVAPVSVALWAALGAGLGEAPAAPRWPFWVLHALALLQVGLVVTALLRYRVAWAYAVPAALGSLAYTAAAWFFGGMSIANVWL